MKKVLIALDYNPTAQKVAEIGFSMAKSMNAEVILLHVISDPVYYSSTEYSPIMGFNGYMDMGPMQLNSVDELKKASQHFLDKSKQHLGDKTIQTLVKEGDFADSILETAKEVHADIIVDWISQPEMAGKYSNGKCNGKSFASHFYSAFHRTYQAKEMKLYLFCKST